MGKQCYKLLKKTRNTIPKAGIKFPMYRKKVTEHDVLLELINADVNSSLTQSDVASFSVDIERASHNTKYQANVYAYKKNDTNLCLLQYWLGISCLQLGRLKFWRGLSYLKNASIQCSHEGKMKIQMFALDRIIGIISKRMKRRENDPTLQLFWSFVLVSMNQKKSAAEHLYLASKLYEFETNKKKQLYEIIHSRKDVLSEHNSVPFVEALPLPILILYQIRVMRLAIKYNPIDRYTYSLAIMLLENGRRREGEKLIKITVHSKNIEVSRMSKLAMQKIRSI